MKFSKEEINRMAREIVKDTKEKEQKMIALYKEPINEIIERVLTFTQSGEFIDSEDILYFPEKFPFTSKEYWAAFDFFAKYGQKQKLCSQDPNGMFEHFHYFIEYNGVKYFAYIMWGQGCASGLRLATVKEWKEENKITFEACRSYWNERVNAYEKENSLS